LVGERSADVVVIGAGFTGLSAALHLAEAGFDVVVLDAARVGWGASGRNGGLLIPGQRKGATYLHERYDRAAAQRLFDLAIEARDLQKRLIDRHAIDCAYRQTGYVHAGLTSAQAEELRAEARLMRDVFGYDAIEELGPAGVRALVDSPRYVGGSVDWTGGHFHPLNYAQGLAAAALRAGAVIHEGARVTRLRDGPDGVVAETASGLVRARHGLIATDAYVGAVDARLGAWIMPVGNQIVATEPLGDRLTALLPRDCSVSDAKFVLDYFRPTQDGRLLFGGGEVYTPREPADLKSFVRPYLERVFPQLAGVRLDYAWGGVVSVTFTRNPCFGRRGNMFWALGYSGLGAILATFGGALAAEAIRGTAERFDLMGSMPGAPFPGGAMARTPLYVAGMLYFALRDRIELRAGGRL
jgi:gamma-glutamylputrescine oxidase